MAFHGTGTAFVGSSRMIVGGVVSPGVGGGTQNPCLSGTLRFGWHSSHLLNL